MEKKMKTFLKRLLITALLISIIIPHTNTQYAKAEEKTKDIILQVRTAPGEEDDKERAAYIYKMQHTHLCRRCMDL